MLAGVPDLGSFPALPQPLRAVLGWHARALDRQLQRVAAQRPGVLHVPGPHLVGQDLFARDAFTLRTHLRPVGSPPGRRRRVSGPGVAAPGVEGRVRVVTWNLWWRSGDWRRRQEAIAAVSASEQPDVVGLQEVWTTPDGDQAQLLADRLKMHCVLSPSPAPDRWQRRLGDSSVGIANAVLSRWPVTGSTSAVLPAPAGRAPERTVLHARIDAPGGAIPFVTTRLESAPAASETRCEQVRAIAHLVATHVPGGAHEHPPVVTGDLNAEPDSDEVRLLCGHKTTPVVPGLVLADARRYAETADLGWTWDTRNPHVAATYEPSARIDHVLVGPPGPAGRGHVLHARLIGKWPLDDVWPSDHAGLLVDLAP